MTEPAPRLVRIEPEYGEERTLDLSPVDGVREWVLGRARRLPLAVLDDPFVSRDHALIAEGVEGYSITDLPTSHNGTALNGAALPKGVATPLADGDIIHVGRTRLRFESAGSDGSTRRPG